MRHSLLFAAHSLQAMSHFPEGMRLDGLVMTREGCFKLDAEEA